MKIGMHITRLKCRFDFRHTKSLIVVIIDEREFKYRRVEWSPVTRCPCQVS
jgi:hypothetical protein